MVPCRVSFRVTGRVRVTPVTEDPKIKVTQITTIRGRRNPSTVLDRKMNSLNERLKAIEDEIKAVEVEIKAVELKIGEPNAEKEYLRKDKEQLRDKKIKGANSVAKSR
jgi:septal ring factor EnvC (AmiA/AmiB activator)